MGSSEITRGGFHCYAVRHLESRGVDLFWMPFFEYEPEPLCTIGKVALGSGLPEIALTMLSDPQYDILVGIRIQEHRARDAPVHYRLQVGADLQRELITLVGSSDSRDVDRPRAYYDVDTETIAVVFRSDNVESGFEFNRAGIWVPACSETSSWTGTSMHEDRPALEFARAIPNQHHALLALHALGDRPVHEQLLFEPVARFIRDRCGFEIDQKSALAISNRQATMTATVDAIVECGARALTTTPEEFAVGAIVASLENHFYEI